MFVITHPFTSKNYSLFYNKAIIIYDTEANTYHKFDPTTQTYVTPKVSECGANFKTHGITINISKLVTQGYYNSSGSPYAFTSLEEATLAKLHLLSQLSAQITKDIAYLQAKYAEACPPSLTSTYNTFKLNYPEIFL